MHCTLSCGDQPCPRHLRARARYDPRRDYAQLPGHERYCRALTFEYDSDAEECEATCELDEARAVGGTSGGLPTWAIILIALACVGAFIAFVLIGLYLNRKDNHAEARACAEVRASAQARVCAEAYQRELLRRENLYKGLLTNLFPNIDHVTADAISAIHFFCPVN